MEVEILYLGLAVAFYVDRAGENAGTGRPGAAGWEWSADNAIAGQVRRAIDIHSKSAEPGFVELPFKIQPSSQD